ncbi:MAG: ABC-F family ATP-binding cassette domain-containing protein [Butyrivibrio sp.]|nr:ABC-F family ATP-binding cassette domain-containing protein [Butyrivibrio sp.]
MILSCHDISKTFDGKDVLKQVSFHLEANSKAAIVGINGAGKTTLLRILMGELEPDSGNVTRVHDLTVGYLAQDQNIDSSHTIYEELCEVKREVIDLESSIAEAEQAMSRLSGAELESLMARYDEERTRFSRLEGYAWRSEVNGVARGLGFVDEELNKPISILSGGQKTRVALGKLLLQAPSLIILDEPTNHLDMGSVRWLEGYLANYRGAVLVVSHDRYFLDRIAGMIIEIDAGRSTVFNGNYSDYAVKKEQLRIERWRAYMNQQQEIRHQEAVIDKLRQFNREKSIRRAESREKMLAKIDVLEKPTEIRDDMRITLTPLCESGKDVLHVENIAKSFGAEHLFDHLSFDVRRGERIAVIGDNGTGKTTLLRLLVGEEALDEGFYTLGVKVHIGYYDQEHHVLHDEKTLFEEISDAYPQLNNTEIRSTLAAFLFTGDDVFKRIGDLSGGEKGRVSLAKLMLSEANFLLLDEPTNHLDITSREILETALSGYGGTILYVSHDRYFINRTATRILELKQGQLTNYIGNYDYYLEHCGAVSTEPDSPRTAGMAANTYQYQDKKQEPDGQPRTNAADWKAHKEAQAAKRKREAALKKCEEEISALEERNNAIDAELSDPAVATDLTKVRKLSDEKGALEERLAVLMDEWEQLSEEG